MLQSLRLFRSSDCVPQVFIESVQRLVAKEEAEVAQLSLFGKACGYSIFYVI